MDRARLESIFRYWGDVEAQANLSPLYAVFGHAVADRPELLDIAAEALPGQPAPNVLFAAVHFLLAQTRGEPLAAYYATLGGGRPADDRAAELLEEFCLQNRDQLLPIIRTRLTQTNEVRRSAILLPAFWSVSEETGSPLAMIEIGPSAGLNLLFDRYQYRYGDLVLGAESPVVLETEPRGPMPPLRIPEVASRTGVDINPLDVRDVDDVAWLRALLWPEHIDRLALFDAAVSVARADPPLLHGGDVFELLPGLVAEAPRGAAVTLFATFVLNQFSQEALAQLRTMLIELSYQRPLHLVVMGFSEFVVPGARRTGDTSIWVVRIENGAGRYRLSSIANPHGRWIEPAGAAEWRPWAEAAGGS